MNMSKYNNFSFFVLRKTRYIRARGEDGKHIPWVARGKYPVIKIFPGGDKVLIDISPEGATKRSLTVSDLSKGMLVRQ